MFEKQEGATCPKSIWSVGDSPAKTSRARDCARDSRSASGADCGVSFAESSASSNLDGSSSRTWQAGRRVGCPTCGTTCELSATVRLPSRYLPPTSEPRTSASASSSWPTPTAGDHKASGSRCKGEQTVGNPGTTLTDALLRKAWPTPTAARYGSSNNGSPGDGREQYATRGKPSLDTLAAAQGRVVNPDWVEALMGAPMGWTAGLVAGGKSRKNGSRRAPSKSSHEARTAERVFERSETPLFPSAREPSEDPSPTEASSR